MTFYVVDVAEFYMEGHIATPSILPSKILYGQTAGLTNFCIW